MTARTVLIGLDGATFSILDALMEDSTMPFLKRFAGSGVRAKLRSIVPPLTPPAWTSLMTGRGPGNHGIFDFFQPASPGSRYLRFASSSDVACETIWSMASRHGRTVTVLNFPLMFPPRPVNGYVVPGGWMPWKQLRLGCYPANLYDRLKELPDFNARELAMDMAVEEKAIEGCRDDEYEDWIRFHIRREQHWFEIAQYLMREDPSDLTAVLLDGVDKLQHLCWAYLDPSFIPAPTAQQQAIRALCLEYFHQLDAQLESIVALAGPHANVVLASDHGFGPTADIFYVNTWLEQHGYLAWADGAAASDDQAVLGLSDLTRHVYRLDWSRTTAFAATPSSFGIHIVKAGQSDAPGVPAADYERFRARLIAELRDATDEATGQPIVTDIWTREEAFGGPRGELGPDLTLALWNNASISILPAPGSPQTGGVVQPRAKLSGAHRPQGIFIAAGPAFQAGVSAPEISILDVAPTLLYSLDLPIPGELEGRLPVEVIEPEMLRVQPVRDDATVVGEHAVPAYTPAGIEGSIEIVASELDAEEEAAVMTRLRALGYVE